MADPQRNHAQADQDRRQRDLAAKLDAGRQARDIGKIPPIADLDRRQACADSFRLFCETYYPAAFNLGWSDDHLAIIAKIETAVFRGDLFAYAMPRGSGKTTLCLAAVKWAALYGLHAYICLIGSAAPHAKSLLSAIKTDLLVNPLLLADFPEVCQPIRRLENNARKQAGQLCCGELTHPIWGTDKLVLPTIHRDALPAGLNEQDYSPASGTIITVAGLDSNIRGQQHTRVDGTVARPTLVILDDPQTRQSAASPSQTKHRLSILNGDVLGMAGPGRKIAGFMPCTKIYTEDLADQVLDRQLHPEWQGICTKMLYRFPKNEELWEQYAEIRADGLRDGDGGAAATEYYRKHRKKMDAGAKVAWPARHDPDELSAVQHAMNLKLRDEPAFFAEYQNEPVIDQAEDVLVTPAEIMQRVNDRPAGEIPQAATCLTAYIDVQGKLLYYLIAAWEPDFTGCVVDYGTFPDQKRRAFTLRDAKRTLRRLYQGAGEEGAILAGLKALGGELLEREFPVAGRKGQSLKLERLLIDLGYKAGVVGQACRSLGSVAMPAKGAGLTAANKPMSSYKRKPGERHGHNWYMPAVARTAEVRHVMIDTNYWKTFIHERLNLMPGDRGALTLYGKSTQHGMIADHIGASETTTRTEGQGRIVHEWKLKPARPDNHLFDCLVGSAVAASMCGIKAGDESFGEQRARRKVKLSELK